MDVRLASNSKLTVCEYKWLSLCINPLKESWSIQDVSCFPIHGSWDGFPWMDGWMVHFFQLPTVLIGKCMFSFLLPTATEVSQKQVVFYYTFPSQIHWSIKILSCEKMIGDSPFKGRTSLKNKHSRLNLFSASPVLTFLGTRDILDPDRRPQRWVTVPMASHS